MTRGGLIIGLLLITPPAVAGPAPSSLAIRDTIAFDPDAFSGFLDQQSFAPDERIFLAESEIHRIDHAAELAKEKPFRIKLPKPKPALNRAQLTATMFFEPTRGEDDNLQVVRAVSEWRGLDPDFMARMAYRESSLNNRAQAKTSSGAGLFQFTAGTWLCTLLDHGTEYRVANISFIQRAGNGRCTVDNPYIRASLLALRFDSELNTKLASDLTIDHFNSLQDFLGRSPNAVELYITHFFGESVGKKFIALALRDPFAIGAPLFPSAASTNYRVFYRKDGTPKQLVEIYNDFAKSVQAQG